MVGERGFEPPTPWSRISKRYANLLIRLGWWCVQLDLNAWFSALIGPKLDPSCLPPCPPPHLELNCNSGAQMRHHGRRSRFSRPRGALASPSSQATLGGAEEDCRQINAATTRQGRDAPWPEAAIQARSGKSYDLLLRRTDRTDERPCSPSSRALQ
jgi:hypothetical protein